MKMFLLACTLTAASCLFLTPLALRAQVPQLVNYQGRVAVGAVNFSGSGQFKFALVNTNGSTSYWSNDETSAAGSQPTAAVALTVTNGLYSVLLGDTSLTNMTAIPVSAWSNADVRLRVWFNDGTHGFQLLTPDQRLAPNGYLPDSSVTTSKIATGAVGSAQLAANAVQSGNILAGAVGNAQLASGAVDSSKLAPGALSYANGGTNATTLSGTKANLGISNSMVVLSTRVTLDGNIDTGSGTDQTAQIQAILDTASASTPLWLIWDGVAITSNTLVLKSHTYIDSGPAGGIFLANNSNCHALTNELSGSTIADTDIQVRGLTINCNGYNQSKFQGGNDLDTYAATGGVTTNGSTTVNYGADPNYGLDTHRVAVGQSVSGTNIPAGTYIAAIASATQATMTQAATGPGTGLTFSLAGGMYDRVTSWNYGIWFSGFENVQLQDVVVRNAPTFAFTWSNGSDFVMENCRALWDDNMGPQTLGGGTTTAGNATISYSPDPNFGAYNAVVRHGMYVTGSNIPADTYVDTIPDSTHCTLTDGANPVKATGTGGGITFTFYPTTNQNHDGIHMYGNLDSGTIENFRTNGDDTPLAFNTDEAAQYHDSRRGTGGAISNITAENIRLDNSTEVYLFYGSNGTGTLDNIIMSNIFGNIISGNPYCAGAANAGPYYGRFPMDAALASVGNVTIDGWFPIANGIPGANVNPQVLNAKSFVYMNMPPSVTVISTGSTSGTGSSPSAAQVAAVLPQAIAVTSSPTFANTNLTGTLDLSTTNNTGTAGVIKQNGAVLLQTYGTNNFFLGGGNFALTGTSEAGFGTRALMNLTSGSGNAAFGFDALESDTSGSQNTALGSSAGLLVTTGGNNTFVGSSAGGAVTTQSYNVALGIGNLATGNPGDKNCAVGSLALSGHNGGFSGQNNTALGGETGYIVTSGSNNTLIGFGAGSYNLSTGNGNIIVGYDAGNALTTANYNIVIGYNITPPSNTTDAQLTIGNLIFGTGLVAGGIGAATPTSVSTGKVGIKNSAPSYDLDVSGSIRATNILHLNPIPRPASGSAGDIYVDSSDGHTYEYNGSVWAQLDH